MVRHSCAVIALFATLILALVTSACGIKGPLVSAPKPEPAKDAAKPAAPVKP